MAISHHEIDRVAKYIRNQERYHHQQSIINHWEV